MRASRGLVVDSGAVTLISACPTLSHPLPSSIAWISNNMNRLKATLLGMVGSTIQKYPSASKGNLKNV